MVTLKLAKPEDAKRLGEVLFNCLKETYGDDPRIGSVEDYVNYFKKNKCNDTVLGIYDSKIAGFCNYGKELDDNFFTDAGEVYNLYILKDFQKHGDGRRLLHEAVRKLRQQEYNTAVVWIDEDNKNAMGFYEALGFKNSNLSYDYECEGKTYKKIQFMRNI